ncbi:nuclear transport factor 2 family protein [Faunimonas sp. B44]|uniref:nuclear transport factor 2 family protein n=1 Tax=Faunimonas sp. B44 TaxID=3461493 RepID=UPI004043F951
MNDQTTRPGASRNEEALVAASSRLAAALAQGDAAALEAITEPDFTAIDEGGLVRSRTEAAAARETAPDAADTRWTVQDYGTLAMVTGKAAVPGGERVALDVFVNRGGTWRALVHHLNVVADPASPSTHPAPVARDAGAPPPDCENPCAFVPYEAKEQAERDIITSFQTLEKAVTRNDADEWVKHMADEFIVYRTRQHPTTKAERAGHLRNQKAVNAETFVAAVEAMKLWVFGDAAVMRADHVMPGNRRPPYRATRFWVKRDGRWQMAISQQTTRPA